MSTAPPPPSDAARDATNLARLVGLRKMQEGRSDNREAEAEEQQREQGGRLVSGCAYLGSLMCLNKYTCNFKICI